MYKKIENDSFFEDIKSEKAKENFNILVDYLCSMPVADSFEEDITINGDFYEEHNYVADTIFSLQNRKVMEKVLKERAETNTSGVVDGYSYIYELDRDILLTLGTTNYYRSLAALEHELTHIIMALNNNNPKPQYNEILSYFVEFLTLYQLSQKENNQDIYNNAFINRCITRMSFRVYSSDFSDESLESNSDFLRNANHNSFPYMLGFIYAARLLDIYKQDKNVLEHINDVLEGKETLDQLLKKYNVSLEDPETVKSFINMCNNYNDLVTKKYTRTELHSVK